MVKPEILKTLYGTKLLDKSTHSLFFNQIVTIVPCPDRYLSIDSKNKVWVQGNTNTNNLQETLWLTNASLEDMIILDDTIKMLYAKEN